MIRGGSVDEPGFRDPPPVSILTGASGWLGRTLVPLVAARAGALRCLVRSTIEASELELISPNVTAVPGDLRNPMDLDALFDGVAGATVFHAGSVIHPERYAREFFDVNVGGTDLVLDRARRAGASRFVYVSSNSPFGVGADPGDVFDEDAPYRPASAYGRSKMEAERLIQRAFRNGDLETVIVRCPWFYGPNQPPRQTRFLALVRRGRLPLVGDGSNRRSLVYAGSLAEGLVRAELNTNAAGRSYWMADLRPYTMLEIIDGVKRALAAEGLSVVPRQLRLPSFVSEVAGAGDRLLERTGRYSQELHVLWEMNKTIACSPARAERELGFRPREDLFEGMRASVRWCLDRGESL